MVSRIPRLASIALGLGYNFGLSFLKFDENWQIHTAAEEDTEQNETGRLINHSMINLINRFRQMLSSHNWKIFKSASSTPSRALIKLFFNIFFCSSLFGSLTHIFTV